MFALRALAEGRVQVDYRIEEDTGVELDPTTEGRPKAALDKHARYFQ